MFLPAPSPPPWWGSVLAAFMQESPPLVDAFMGPEVKTEEGAETPTRQITQKTHIFSVFIHAAVQKSVMFKYTSLKGTITKSPLSMFASVIDGAGWKWNRKAFDKRFGSCPWRIGCYE